MEKEINRLSDIVDKSKKLWGDMPAVKAGNENVYDEELLLLWVSLLPEKLLGESKILKNKAPKKESSEIQVPKESSAKNNVKSDQGPDDKSDDGIEAKTADDKKNGDDKDKDLDIKTSGKKNGRLDISVKRYNEERAAMLEYSRITEMYNKFMQSYLYDGSAEASGIDPAVSKEKKKREMKNGDEVISYLERKEIAKAMQMNALLGAEHNYIEPGMKQLYETWCKLSWFNQQMSFIMYDTLQF